MNDLGFFAALGVASLALGCGGADTANRPTTHFPTDPYATLASEKGQLSIEVRTGPSQPPGRGTTDVLLTIRDAAGDLLDGLDVDATPWMPAMGHGASVVPRASREGDGSYAIRNVAMFMPGVWELRTTFSGAVMDTATPIFEVP